ncbi:MAG: hypothetical protein PHX05_01740 [Acidobacteriota bacterium]|nr:hypothetical protein [Acidobacteriota bacterium]
MANQTTIEAKTWRLFLVEKWPFLGQTAAKTLLIPRIAFICMGIALSPMIFPL